MMEYIKAYLYFIIALIYHSQHFYVHVVTDVDTKSTFWHDLEGYRLIKANIFI